MKVTRKAGKASALKQTITELDGQQGRVGWFPSAVYEGGQPVAGVAFVQEHGSAKRSIPPRPFMRPTATEKREEWAKTVAQLTKAAALGKIAPENIMRGLTLAAEGHVRATITKITAPPLSPVTVELRRRRRGGETVTGKTVGEAAKASRSAFFKAPSKSEAKPLVDTGILLNTLTSEVEK
jgi:hypothetical protein